MSLNIPKKISELPSTISLAPTDLFVRVGDGGVTSKLTLLKLQDYLDGNDTFVTGVTYTQSASTLTLTRNDGVSLNTTIISGSGGETFTGGTVSGATIFTNGLSGNSISATTYLNLPTFTGNTSGSCINQLWVSNISGCSPVTIGETIFDGNLEYNGSSANGDKSLSVGFETTAGIESIPNTTVVSALTINWVLIFGKEGSFYLPFVSGDCKSDPLLIGLTESIENTNVCLDSQGVPTSPYYITLSGGPDPEISYPINLGKLPCGLIPGSLDQGLSFTYYGSDPGDTYTGGTGYTTASIELITDCIGTSGANYCYSEGYQTVASGNTSHAEGSQTVAGGEFSHSEGSNTIASGESSHAEGSDTIASGGSSHTEGNDTTASGDFSHAEGEGTNATGRGSHAEGGVGNIASGLYSHVEGGGVGSFNNATNTASHAEGLNTVASGLASHAEGDSTNATQRASHAEGNLTIASGQYSHAEGNDTTASGTASHAEGEGTTASGNQSHAEGINTTASGVNSHSEGNTTLASGDYSHAEGFGTSAIANYSHTEGRGTVTSGSSAHSEGRETNANGDYSHSGGYWTRAEGRSSHASGEGGSGAYLTRVVANGLASFVHFKTFDIGNQELGAYGDYSAILGGTDHNIGTGATSSVIIGGQIGRVNDNVQRSVVLGGSTNVATKNDTVYLSKLNMSDVPAYDDDGDAGANSLTVGDIYQTTGSGAAPLNVAGILMIKQ
jgi:hypothetical protein